MKLTIRIADDTDGSMTATVDEMPGCFASGFTLPELFEALVEAVQLWRGDTKEKGDGA